MSEAIYLPFDTETGGLLIESPLLTAHFAVCDKDMNVLDELELVTKPEDGNYFITPRAMEINKIDLIAHDKVALPYNKAGGLLREFLWKHSKNGATKLIPVGKNVTFDVVKVNNTILQGKSWNHFVSYRTYDITSIVIFLKKTGKLPADAPDSLEGLSNFFGIPIDAHTARGDNLAGIALVKKLESL